MVNTRSQILRENRVEQTEDDRFSDNEDNVSVADHYRESYFGENDDETMRSMERDQVGLRLQQRFIDMNRQIGELTSIVRALTEKITTCKEGNHKDVLNDTSTRSDMATRESANPMPTTNAQPPRRTLPSFPSPQINDVMTEIHNMRTTMTDDVIQPEILQTQVPLFRGNREKHNEFERMLKDHHRPHMNELTEEQMLN